MVGSEAVAGQALSSGEYSDSRVFWASITAVATGLAWAYATFWGWGAIGLCFFGAYAVWGLSRLPSRRVRLRITDEGIVDLPPLSRLARGKFPLYGLGPAAFNPWSLSGRLGSIVDELQGRLDQSAVEAVRTSGNLP